MAKPHDKTPDNNEIHVPFFIDSPHMVAVFFDLLVL